MSDEIKTNENLDMATGLEICRGCGKSFKSVGKHRRFCKGHPDELELLEERVEVEPEFPTADMPKISNLSEAEKSNHLILQLEADQLEPISTEETMTWQEPKTKMDLSALTDKPPSLWQRIKGRFGR